MTDTLQDSILPLSGPHQQSGPHFLQRSAQAQQVTQQPSDPRQVSLCLTYPEQLGSYRRRSVCFLAVESGGGLFWITCVMLTLMLQSWLVATNQNPQKPLKHLLWLLLLSVLQTHTRLLSPRRLLQCYKETHNGKTKCSSFEIRVWTTNVDRPPALKAPSLSTTL